MTTDQRPPNGPEETADLRAELSRDDDEQNLDRALQDLTVAQLIGLLLKKPSKTTRSLRSAPRAAPRVSAPALSAPAPLPAPAPTVQTRRMTRRLDSLLQPKYLQLLLYALAIVFAYMGSIYARGAPGVTRYDYFSMHYAAPYFWAGFLLWLLAEVVGNWARLRDGWQALDSPGRWRWLARLLPALIWIHATWVLATSLNAPRDQSVGMALDAAVKFATGGVVWLLINLGHWWLRRQLGLPSRGAAEKESRRLIEERIPMRRPVWREISPLRVLMAVLALAGSLYVWANSTGNYIPVDAIQVWFGTALLWCFVFAPLRWNAIVWASDAIDFLRRIPWRRYRWAIVLFTLLMILGFSFRYDELHEYPRELYGDLVEKIQDAYGIYHEDDYRVYMQNIGGREPLHFYTLSILASQEGMNFDFFALKSMTALWTILAMPLMFWFAVEVFAVFKPDRKWAIIVALAMLGFVAASFWHVVLGRQGMRINTTSFWTPLLMIFFVKALRTNRRSYYILAGLFLGFGLISYQAMRMMPASIVVGVLVTLLVRRVSWRERVSYLLNLVVLAGIALAVFLPVMRFWTEYPQEYLRRTSTRILGDMPTTEEERNAFLLDSGARFLKNLHQTLLIYHYYNEATFINSAPGEPALDPVSAAFIVLGAAAWLALMARRRDAFIWYVPLFLFFALLPTALALSFPIEVPSFTRASTAITPSYLIAGLPLAIFCRQLYRCLPRIPGILAGLGFGALVILAANEYNANLYWGYFTENYNRSSHPYRQAGTVVRGFVDSDGAYGNVYIDSYAHWWDYRAVGIESGIMHFQNGMPISQLPQFINRNLGRQDVWQLMPERDLLILYPPQDVDGEALLQEWFPQGRRLYMETHHPDLGYFAYRVPALGADGIQAFLDEYA